MIQLSGAGKRFGPKVLYEGLDWMIGPKEKAGIVGGNGTGKSHALKGSCRFRNTGLRLSQLPEGRQNRLSSAGRSVAFRPFRI